MKCPIDGNALAISERNGIEIDYCPQCRGVWLDRGELDKIIERAAQYDAPPPMGQGAPGGYADYEAKRKNDERYGEYYDDDDYKYRNDPRYKRKKSILGEIFDFD
jgi:hypothetical protein